jgi:hypothetical protein
MGRIHSPGRQYAEESGWQIQQHVHGNGRARGSTPLLEPGAFTGRHAGGSIAEPHNKAVRPDPEYRCRGEERDERVRRGIG